MQGKKPIASKKQDHDHERAGALWAGPGQFREVGTPRHVSRRSPPTIILSALALQPSSAAKAWL